MSLHRRLAFRLVPLVALVLAGTACGAASKASAPAEIAAAGDTAATTTTEVTDSIEPPSTSTTPPAAATTSTTQAPQTTTTIVAIDDRPRTTAPATEDEPVPVGEVIELTGIWDIVVVDVQLDATDAVLAYADINPVPEPGFQYVMVAIEGRYLGERTAQPAFVWFMTDVTEVFEPWIPGCGVVPDSIYDVFEVAPGETFGANVCLPVPTTSVQQGLALSLQPLGEDPFFFELAEDA